MPNSNISKAELLEMFENISNQAPNISDMLSFQGTNIKLVNESSLTQSSFSAPIILECVRNPGRVVVMVTDVELDKLLPLCKVPVHIFFGFSEKDVHIHMKGFKLSKLNGSMVTFFVHSGVRQITFSNMGIDSLANLVFDAVPKIVCLSGNTIISNNITIGQCTTLSLTGLQNFDNLQAITCKKILLKFTRAARQLPKNWSGFPSRLTSLSIEFYSLAGMVEGETKNLPADAINAIPRHFTSISELRFELDGHVFDGPLHMISLMQVVKMFYFARAGDSKNKDKLETVIEIVQNYLDEGLSGLLDCQEELIEAGYSEYAR